MMNAKHIRLRSFMLSTSLLVTSVVVAVVVSEFFARLVEPRKHYIWPPNMERVLRPNVKNMPGIFGVSRFNTNSDGIRGDELTLKSTINILCIGGSTTECLYLDQKETWPHLVQVMLQKKFGPKQHVWVGNIGKSGRRTREHLMQMQKLLPELEQIDIVILLLGCNDVMRRLAEDNEYNPNTLQNQQGGDAALGRAFALRPQVWCLWPPHKTALFSRLRAAMIRIQPATLFEDDVGQAYQIRRKWRASSPKIRRTLPDMSLGLQEYSRNLHAIADLAVIHGVRLILMTQPYLYRGNVTEKEMSLFWMGGIGRFDAEPGHEYYSIYAMEEAFRLYNEELQIFCEERGLEIIDLAVSIPKTTDVFYDEVHFTEHGAVEVASVVAEYVMSTSLFHSRKQKPVSEKPTLANQ